MPEIVQAGKLYKAIAPLYNIDDKKHPFVRDKAEYVSIYQDKIVKNYSIMLKSYNTKKELSKSDFRNFIYDTTDYSDELIRLSKHFGVNKFLIEIIAAYITLTHKNKNIEELFTDSKKSIKFIEAIQKKFPEISIKGKQSLRGIVSGRFQSIAINNRFLKKIEDITDIFDKYGYAVLVKDKSSSDKYEEMSIGEFLDNANKLRPRIITRYKGLNLLVLLKLA